MRSRLVDSGPRNGLANIKVLTLILHDANDSTCLFDLAKIMHIRIKGSQVVMIDSAVHRFIKW
jgi:pimeloyl-ACP methyl ester carboxylesterase